MEDYYCEYCCNFDKEHIGMDGTASCKLTNTLAYCEESANDCKFFNIPAADVQEVKHGYWTEKYIPLDWCDDDVDIVYECSICKSEEPYKSPRCPECGAKMDGD